MAEIHPMYKKLLIAAIALYIIATAVMLSDLYIKVEQINHSLMHITGKH
ncbi:hypothetical protein ACFL5Y_02995 [Candidatus Omnitrophota bacterium]